MRIHWKRFRRKTQPTWNSERHKERQGDFIRFWLSSSCYVIGLSKTCCILSFDGNFRNFHLIMNGIEGVFSVAGNVWFTISRTFCKLCIKFALDLDGKSLFARGPLDKLWLLTLCIGNKYFMFLKNFNKTHKYFMWPEPRWEFVKIKSYVLWLLPIPAAL